MTNDKIFDLMSGINEDYLAEAENTLILRNRIKRGKKKKTAIVSTVAVCFTVFVVAYELWYGNIFKKDNIKTKDGGAEEIVTEENTAANTEYPESGNVIIAGESTTQISSEGKTVTNENKTEKTTENTIVKGAVSTTVAVSSTRAIIGDNIGGTFSAVPDPPCFCGAENGIEVTGDELTDSEAGKYFDVNGESIKYSLSLNGVNTDNFKISQKGYCHICYDGTNGKRLNISQNVRDYLVYSGDNLVAIVTLVKNSDGSISDTPMFGATWFKAFNDFLKSNKGKELIFIYAKNTELVLGTDVMMNPQGYADPTEYFDKIPNVYEYFYNEKAVYVP